MNHNCGFEAVIYTTGISLFLFSSYLLSSSFLLLLPHSHNSDPGSHSRRFFPLPTTARAFLFDREKTSALASLVELRLPTLGAFGMRFLLVFQWEKFTIVSR